MSESMLRCKGCMISVKEIFCGLCKITANCDRRPTSRFTKRKKSLLMWTLCTLLCVNAVFFPFLTLGNNSVAGAWTGEVGETVWTLCSLCCCYDIRKTKCFILVLLSWPGGSVNFEVRIFFFFFCMGYYVVLKCGPPDGLFNISYLRSLYLATRKKRVF
jgi:hypothetical protein